MFSISISVSIEIHFCCFVVANQSSSGFSCCWTFVNESRLCTRRLLAQTAPVCADLLARANCAKVAQLANTQTRNWMLILISQICSQLTRQASKRQTQSKQRISEPTKRVLASPKQSSAKLAPLCCSAKKLLELRSGKARLLIRAVLCCCCCCSCELAAKHWATTEKEEKKPNRRQNLLLLRVCFGSFLFALQCKLAMRNQ